MRFLITATLAVASVLSLLGCQSKPKANYGGDGTIVVAVDPPDRAMVGKILASRFGRIINTPQPEPEYNLVITDGDGLTEYVRSPYVFLFAPLDGAGSTSKLLGKMLSSDVKAGVVSGEYFIFARKDPWARGQQLYIVTGPNSLDMGLQLAHNVDSLKVWVDRLESEARFSRLFERGEHKELAQEATAKHGWRIRLQNDYSLEQDNDSLSFVRWMRYIPERWVMVHWGEMSDSSQLTAQFVLQKRQVIGRYFPDPVITEVEDLTSEPVLFNERRVLLVRGLWRTDSNLFGGGPFFSYALWVEKENRYYIIDCAVYAPGKDKMPYLKQLDVLAHTFIPPSEVKGQNHSN